jgi:Cdc6-like AAA superfamily ATPase
MLKSSHGKPRSLLLTGPPGTGKSWMMHVIYNVLKLSWKEQLEPVIIDGKTITSTKGIYDEITGGLNIKTSGRSIKSLQERLMERNSIEIPSIVLIDSADFFKFTNGSRKMIDLLTFLIDHGTSIICTAWTRILHDEKDWEWSEIIDLPLYNTMQITGILQHVMNGNVDDSMKECTAALNACASHVVKNRGSNVKKSIEMIENAIKKVESDVALRNRENTSLLILDIQEMIEKDVKDEMHSFAIKLPPEMLLLLKVMKMTRDTTFKNIHDRFIKVFILYFPGARWPKERKTRVMLNRLAGMDVVKKKTVSDGVTRGGRTTWNINDACAQPFFDDITSLIDQSIKNILKVH